MKTKYEQVRGAGTAAFVTATGRDAYQAALKREQEQIIDPSTGRVREALLEPALCPVCERNDSKPLFWKDGLRFVKCRTCGLLYINPRLKEDALLANYGESESKDLWVDVLLSEAQIDYDRRKFAAALDQLEAHLGRRGRILDVGCSIGLFLSLAGERGWETHGLELNEKAVQYARGQLGLKVQRQTLQEAGFPAQYFDVITLWEVLEHVADPSGVLRELHRILRPGGTLGLMLPNANSLAVRVMRERSSAFGPGHLWYFTPANLERLLAKLGYRLFYTSTQLSELDTILSYLDYSDPYADSRVPADLLPEEFLAQLEKVVFERNMGYKLYALAERA